MILTVQIFRGRLQSVMEKVYAIVVLLVDKTVGQMPELLNITEELGLNGRKSLMIFQCLIAADCR